MKQTLLTILICTLIACSSSPSKEDPLLVEAPSPHKVEKMYQPFCIGMYEEYVSHIYSLQDKSENYRQQALNMFKQQYATIIAERKGVANFSVTRIEQSPQNPLYADAYILMHYADSTSELIVLPMVREEGKWWFK